MIHYKLVLELIENNKLEGQLKEFKVRYRRTRFDGFGGNRICEIYGKLQNLEGWFNKYYAKPGDRDVNEYLWEYTA